MNGVGVPPTMDGAGSPGHTPINGASTQGALVGNWSRVKHLVDEWAPPQDWGRVGAVELALHVIRDFLGELSGCVVAGIVG